MTPEKAHKLREKATPGPWERHPDKPRVLCNLKHKFAVHVELVKDRGLKPHPEDVANTELIAAAPDLAELVAGLRYEYAVQAKHGDVWEYENCAFSDRCPMDDLYSEDPSLAYWWDCVEDAQRAAAYIVAAPTRIVRRLVGDPEVTE